MTRIVAGEWGGRRIKVPSSGVRPTSERVRESICNRLEHLTGGLAGLRVIDIYAGSGAVGLELLSRGASEAVFVERDRGALTVLRANVASLSADSVEILAISAEQAAEKCRKQFNIVFLDPPYDLPTSQVRSVLQGLLQEERIAPDSLVVVESRRRSSSWEWPGEILPLDHRDSGDTRVWYGRTSPFPATE